MTIKRIESSARMSQAVVANGFVFLAGQIAPEPSGADVESQTLQVLGEIDRLLAAAGTDKSRVVSATIYLADIGTFAAMNRAWESWVVAGAQPARATVEAKLAAPEFRVEIQVVALEGDTRARVP
ncbi:MAG: RidA family protein [Steroidobacteraceae bacterium]